MNVLPRATTETAVKFTYGLQVAVGPTTKLFANFIERVIWAATPGSYIADYFTWMKHLPNALAPWKRKAQAHYQTDNAAFIDLYRGVKRSVVRTCFSFSGCSLSSFRRTTGKT